MALASVDVNVPISVFALAEDDVLAVECVVLLQRIAGPKTVSVDGQRLPLVVGQQESNRRFPGGFRRMQVSPVPQSAMMKLVACLRDTFRVRVWTARERDGRSHLCPFFPAFTSATPKPPQAIE